MVQTNIDVIVRLLQGDDDSKKTKNLIQNIDSQLSKTAKANKLSQIFKLANIEISKTGKTLRDSLSAKRIGSAEGIQRVIHAEQNLKMHNKAVTDSYKQSMKARAESAAVAGQEIANRLKNDVKAHQSASKKIRGFWSMNFLTFLFVGQAIKRISERIATSSINAFQSVAGGTNAASMALTQMGIGFKGIQIAIGDALGSALLPYSEAIFDIMQNVINWISENQKLVAGLVIGGIVLGTFLILFSQLMLAMNSIMGIISTVKEGFILLNGVMGASTAGAAGAGFMTLLPILGIVAAAVAAFALLWATDLGGFRDLAKKTWDNIGSIIKNTWDSIKLVIETTLGLIIAIFKGDWDEVGNILVNFAIRAIEIFKAIFSSLKNLFINMAKSAVRIFIDLIRTITNAVIGLVKVFGKVANFLGADFDLSGLDKATKKVNELRDNLVNSELLSFTGTTELPTTAISSIADTEKTGEKSTVNNLTFNITGNGDKFLTDSIKHTIKQEVNLAGNFSSK